MAKRFRLDHETGASIMRLRTQSGTSQETLARRLKVSMPTISKMESGRPPDSIDLKMLADYFGVSVDVVCGRAVKPIQIKPVLLPEEEFLRVGRAAERDGAHAVADHMADELTKLYRMIEQQQRQIDTMKKGRR